MSIHRRSSMRHSLWYGSLLVTISGSLFACMATPESEDDFFRRAVTLAPAPSDEVEIAVGPQGRPLPAGGVSPSREEVSYPAPHPSMPQITNHGGEILHDPVIVSITFPGDPLAAKIAAFGEEV